MPCADEVWWLQNRQGPECEFFQAVADLGHYGRNPKGTTRQGIYAAAPSGEFLASINTNDADAMADMLTRALEKWKSLSKEKRLREKPLDEKGRTRLEASCPAAGLVLRQYSRDLPREKPQKGWTAKAWNTDTAWFTAEEARSMLPAEPKAGDKHAVPEALVRRLARCQLLDNVRGQTSDYPDRCVSKAGLDVEVVSVEGDLVTVKLTGATVTLQNGKWPIGGNDDADKSTEQERGYQATLLGKATYDLKKKRFTSFELVAAGMRTGGTQYNVRANDLGAAPLGFVFQLATDSPSDRVAPAFVWAYGWKR